MGKPKVRVFENGRLLMVTPEQLLLHGHLMELGIETVYEFRFCLEREFRFDLYCERLRMGFECNGHFKGRHGAGWSSDSTKINLAQLKGYRVMVFSNQAVSTGAAKKFLQEWMGK